MVDWVKLELHLGEEGAVAKGLAALPQGLTIRTLADRGDTEDTRRQVYDLNKACSADIPGRGEFFTFEEYVARRFDSPAFRPDGLFLLDHDGRLVGLCALSWKPDTDWAFIEMTGVLREYRRRGFARALKAATIARAHEWGVSSVRTVNHPTNTPIIASNEALGFRLADFPLG